MRKETEQGVQKAILDYLKLKKFLVFKHRNVGIFKQSTQQYIPLSYGEKGISDIIGCSTEGRFIAVEVKKPGGKPSEHQLQFLEEVRSRGGIGILAYSLDEVIEALGNKSRQLPRSGQSQSHYRTPQPTK